MIPSLAAVFFQGKWEGLGKEERMVYRVCNSTGEVTKRGALLHTCSVEKKEGIILADVPSYRGSVACSYSCMHRVCVGSMCIVMCVCAVYLRVCVSCLGGVYT